MIEGLILEDTLIHHLRNCHSIEEDGEWDIINSVTTFCYDHSKLFLDIHPRALAYDDEELLFEDDVEALFPAMEQADYVTGGVWRLSDSLPENFSLEQFQEATDKAYRLEDMKVVRISIYLGSKRFVFMAPTAAFVEAAAQYSAKHRLPQNVPQQRTQ